MRSIFYRTGILFSGPKRDIDFLSLEAYLHPAMKSLVASSLLATMLALTSPASGAQAAPASHVKAEVTTETGIASWYGSREAGRKTASGTVFDPSRLSAAHRTLPLGTCVRVTHLGNGRFVIVPVIDRGPYVRGRLIDLSEMAAQALDMKSSGLAQVRVDVVRSCLGEKNARPTERS